MILKEVEKTPEELAKEQVNDFVSNLNLVVNEVETAIQKVTKKFWDNPVVLAEGLGKDTGKLFTLLSSLETLLAQYDENYEKFVVPYEFTVNKDGSVTIGDKIEE